ncbi:phosphatase PAP2 family protein [uncultured Corynebacterium sp.]|uniref:phosphatase PAP2 family protein n=1 Tax=uncultured Corynebacterium sp. TaxID=159447 RepID=UPI0025E126EB|nr:phosphatase PAP2 family protein [uncultured Corynebacterium sp.]
MKIGSRRFVRAGLRSTAAASAIALTLPLAPVAIAQEGIPGLPSGDSASGIADVIPGIPGAVAPETEGDAVPGEAGDAVPGATGDALPGITGVPPMGPPSFLPSEMRPEVDADGAPVPEPFPADFIARPFQSDVSGEGWFYHSVVDPFVELRESHPEVMEQNLDIVVEINNAAKDDRAAQLLALQDDHDDPLVNLSAGFGEQLGAHFRAAVEEGRLPKMTALMSGNLARAGGVASSTFAEKYTYGYDRPFVVAPDRIERYYRDQPGDDDPYSETPAYPSGHTNKAAWTATLMSLMLPELAPQIQARSSEAGQSRLVMGVHYPLDVMGGRMMGNQAAADRWADPEFRPLIQAAAAEVRAELEWRCGGTLAECAANDTPYMDDAAAVAQYTERMTYGFDRVGEAGVPVTVPAGYAGLLETTHPDLTEEQRVKVLEATAIDSGFPLDRTDGRAAHVRMNMAAAMTADVTVNADGSLTVNGVTV